MFCIQECVFITRFRVVVRNFSGRGGLHFFLSRGLSIHRGLKPREIHRFRWSPDYASDLAPQIK